MSFPAPSGAAFAVVIDPAHGGPDTGARGPSGANEKDLVLSFARALRAQLVQQGYRVVMTRDSDTNPSYDERAAIANALPQAIFITLHISSTGVIGTVRTYHNEFAEPFLYSPPSSPGFPAPTLTAAPSASSALPPWREAQRPFLDTSQRLAGILQTGLAQQFANSPALAAGAAVRELRSVTAPAVAIEVSSVAAANPATVAAMAAPLSSAIAKGVSQFQSAQAAPAAQPAGDTH